MLNPCRGRRLRPLYAAPVIAAATLDDFEARRLDSPEFIDFLGKNAGLDRPPAAWDLAALTLVAFYYHPDLDVARAQWAAAQAGRITAGERPNPTVGILMGYNATTPASEITPWIPETALEIPIETAGKRGYRIAQAQNLSEAARLNILSAAWEVRSRLRQAYPRSLRGPRNRSLLGAAGGPGGERPHPGSPAGRRRGLSLRRRPRPVWPSPRAGWRPSMQPSRATRPGSGWPAPSACRPRPSKESACPSTAS